MKTPRQILSERHRSAGPKLDALRERVVAEHLSAQKMETTSAVQSIVEQSTFAEKIWLELIVPCRRIWLGLAATWLLILGAHFILVDSTKPVTLAKVSPPSPEVLTVLKEQKQMMAQLIGPIAAPPSLPGVPGPRSQRREESYAA